MKTEDLKDYIEFLSEGNDGFRSIKNHPIVREILKDENLRFWIPNDVVEIEHESTEDIWEKASAKNIAAFLRLNGFTINFKNRTVSKDGGKNNQRIGRVLQSADPALIKAWKKLTNTNSNPDKKSNRQWVISANPIDICNATYGRKWTSCLKDGGHLYEMENGLFSLIAYLCDTGDSTIKNPHARYLLHVGDVGSDDCKVRKVFKFGKANTPLDEFTLYKGKISQNTTGVLLTDTLYGNCTLAEKDVLRLYIKNTNNEALKDIKSNVVSISVNGLYVNKCFPSTYKKYDTPKVIKKKVDKTNQPDTRMQRKFKEYRYYSVNPNYELLEYVINTNQFTNKVLTDRIFKDANHLNILRKTMVIPTMVKNLEGEISVLKKKLVDSVENPRVLHDISNKFVEVDDRLKELQGLSDKLV